MDVVIPNQKVDHQAKVKSKTVVKTTNHHKINQNHQVKINLLVDHDQVVKKLLNRHKKNQNHNHQVKVKNKLDKKTINQDHQIRKNPVVVEKKLHQVQVNLVHQVNQKLRTKINNKKLMATILKLMVIILKPKMNNHNNADELKVVKNDKHQMKMIQKIVRKFFF